MTSIPLLERMTAALARPGATASRADLHQRGPSTVLLANAYYMLLHAFLKVIETGEHCVIRGPEHVHEMFAADPGRWLDAPAPNAVSSYYQPFNEDLTVRGRIRLRLPRCV